MKNMVKLVSSKAHRFIKLSKVKISAKSPEILLGLGVISGIGALFMMGKQTLKCEKILDSHEKKMEEIEEALEEAKSSENSVVYTEKDAGKDRCVAYLQTGWEFTKLYSPVMALSLVSFSCFFGSHHILKRRNLAITAAYTALDKAFKEYRGRVIESLGEEKDSFFKYGYKKELGKVVSKGEDGEPSVKEEEVDTIPFDENADINKPTAFCFSRQTSSHYHWDPIVNEMTLHAAEVTLNMDFQRDGVLFLNDALKALGMKPVSYGQYIGWCIGKGDPYVKLNAVKVYQPCDPMDIYNNPLGNDKEAIWYLDFNTCGDVHEALGVEKVFGHFE